MLFEAHTLIKECIYNHDYHHSQYHFPIVTLLKIQ